MGAEHESVEAVGLGLTLPDRQDRALEEVAQAFMGQRFPGGGVLDAQPEVVDLEGVPSTRVTS